MVPNIPGADQWLTTYLIPALAGVGGSIFSQLIPRLVDRKLKKRDNRHQWYSKVHGAATNLIKVIQNNNFYEDRGVSEDAESEFEVLHEKFTPARQDADYTVVTEEYNGEIQPSPNLIQRNQHFP